MRNHQARSIRILGAGLILWCSLAGAQPRPAGSPPVSSQPSEASRDVLGRNTPRGCVLRFMVSARAGDYETAARYLNTRLRGKPLAILAQRLFVVLNRRLPAGLGLANLSDSPEGVSPFLTRPDQNLVGTITSDSGNIDIIVERVDRGKEGLIWLFSNDTLTAIPRLHDEIDAFAIEDILPKFLVEIHIAQIPLFGWLALLAGIPLLYLSTIFLNRLLSPIAGYVRRRRRKQQDLPDPVFLPVPTRLLLVAFAIRWALSSLSLPLLTRQFWSSAAGVIFITAVVWLFVMLNGAGEVLLRRRMLRFQNVEGTASMLRLGRRAIDFLLVFAGILAGLRYFGVNLTAAIAGLGVGGIAIALAAQKTLENVIGGISVVVDKVVRVGEFVKVGEIGGVVEHIGLRSTRLRTMDRTVVSIPNGQIANVNLENISKRDKFWFRHVLSLRRETSVAVMREVLQSVETLLAKDPRVESGSKRVRFLGFGPSSLDVEVFAYILVSDWNAYLEAQQDLLLQAMEMVQAAGTQLAYPSQTLHLATPQAGNPEALSPVDKQPA